jgi:hypothetical protein
MDDIQRKRETRKQKHLERLGADDPCCVVCGETYVGALERHHLAGRAYDEFISIICRNCHRKLSDDQKDHAPKLDNSPALDERLAHFLDGLADFFIELAARLRKFAAELIERAKFTENREA